MLNQVLLPSTVRTATTTTADVTPSDLPGAGAGIAVSVDYTATPNNTETMIASVEAKDLASGKYVTFATFATQTSSVLGATPTTATFFYILKTGVAKTITAANVEIQSLPIPAPFRVRMTHSAAGNWTYTVSVARVL